MSPFFESKVVVVNPWEHRWWWWRTWTDGGLEFAEVRTATSEATANQEHQSDCGFGWAVIRQGRCGVSPLWVKHRRVGSKSWSGPNETAPGADRTEQ